MDSSFHKALASLQDIGKLLIKRGSAMGPLVPMLLLIPVLLGSAWLFRSTFVIRSCPIISTGLVILVLWIVLSYLRHYASFAKNDPDRLQSEEYRYETARLQMIAAKELPGPIPAEELPLEAPREKPPTSTDTDEENAP